MSKVKVNKELYEALNAVIQTHGREWFIEMILLKQHDNRKWYSPSLQSLNELSIEEITKIILYGYELEIEGINK